MQLHVIRNEKDGAYETEIHVDLTLIERQFIERHKLGPLVVHDGITVSELELGRKLKGSYGESMQVETTWHEGAARLRYWLSGGGTGNRFLEFGQLDTKTSPPATLSPATAPAEAEVFGASMSTWLAVLLLITATAAVFGFYVMFEQIADLQARLP